MNNLETQDQFLAYMCKTSFEYDARSCDAKIFPSEKALRKERSCVDECGIVEVLVSLNRVVQEENYEHYRKTK